MKLNQCFGIAPDWLWCNVKFTMTLDNNGVRFDENFNGPLADVLRMLVWNDFYFIPAKEITTLFCFVRKGNMQVLERHTAYNKLEFF